MSASRGRWEDETVKIEAKLPASLARDLKEYAARDGSSMAHIVRQAVRYHLARRRWEDRELLKMLGGEE